MKIAQVSPLYESVPPQLYGGTERIVSYLTEELVRQGHDVTLFASGDSQTSARLRPMCHQALRLGNRLEDPLLPHLLMLQEVFDCADEFDIVHFHVDYLHFPLSRAAGIPQLTTLHGRLDIPGLSELYSEFSDMPVVSISNSQRKPLPHAHWVGTVYHGLPQAQYPFSTKPGKYLAFLGRMSPEKRPDRAIEIALRAGMDIKLAAKVDNADRDWFEATVRPLLNHPRVEYIGEINEEQKKEFLGNAYAMLFPIDWPEPFGLVMIEAMACGTPVIAYPFGSVPEIISDGVNGFLVNSVDEAVQAVGLVEGLDRQEIRTDFDLRFSAQRMAHDYIQVYRQHLKVRSQLSKVA